MGNYWGGDKVMGNYGGGELWGWGSGNKESQYS